MKFFELIFNVQCKLGYSSENYFTKNKKFLDNSYKYFVIDTPSHFPNLDPFESLMFHFCSLQASL